MKNVKNYSPPVPHLLQAQQALAFLHAKVAGCPGTRSYPAPSPSPATPASRSGRPDKLLNEFFINGSNSLLPSLHKLINVIFNKGYLPTVRSEGYIVPIHKKGITNNVDNNRGIMLLSILGKLFTSILNNRLINWAQTYYIYIKAQAGFRRVMVQLIIYLYYRA